MVGARFEGQLSSKFNSRRKTISGFTVIEVLVTLSVLGVFLSVGAGSFGGFMEKNRLKAAAEGISSDLHFARSEAVSRGTGNSVNVSFTTDGGTSWCYGLTTAASCDCTITDTTNASACVIPVAGTNVLRVMNSSEYGTSVSMTSVTFPANTTGFGATRGLAPAGQAVLTTNSKTATVTLSALGRVRVCSDDNIGYPSC